MNLSYIPMNLPNKARKVIKGQFGFDLKDDTFGLKN
jgi:hypothetical protein